MKLSQFKELAKTYDIIPVYKKITADLLTPVLAYLKLRDNNNYCFLLESVEGIGRLARYSFIGMNPVKVIHNQGMEITIRENGSEKTIHQNLFQYLKQEIGSATSPKLDDLPYFTGGIVGYLGYENISLVEDVITFATKNHFGTPDAIFGLYNTIIAFDHYKHQILLIINVHIENSTDLEKTYHQAKNELHNLWTQLINPIEFKSDFQIIKQISPKNEKKEFHSKCPIIINLGHNYQ